jgi:hypothetical protein
MELKRRYSVMVFPQKFDGTTLSLNIVLIPRNQDPFLPFGTGLPAPDDSAIAFADLVPEFELGIVRGLDEFPLSNATAPLRIPVKKPVAVNNAVNKKAILQAIATEFAGKLTLDNTTDKANPVVAEDVSVRKYLPETYRNAFNFTTPRHPNAVTDDSYHCAIRKDAAKKPNWGDTDDVSWGQLYAHILRQPMLARACGMIYSVALSVADDPTLFEKGSYIYADIINADYTSIQSQLLEDADGPFIKRYAARLPRLLVNEARAIFAPLLFPVLYRKTTDAVDPEPKGQWDKIFQEANEYNDGYAKIIHATQPVSGNLLRESQDGFHPVKDLGIRLAWDDEQILIWYIRQLAANPEEPGKRLDAPLGVFGYRIDVKEDVPGADWQGLNKVKSKAVYDIQGTSIGNAADEELELPYQVFPTQLDNDTNASYWLPMYYTNWIGKSLVLKDSDAVLIYKNDQALAALDDPTPKQVGAGKAFDEVPVDAELLYGHTYDFRVRLMDISGGGPTDQPPVNIAAAPTSSVHFKRYIAPSLLRIEKPAKLTVNEIEFFNETKIDAVTSQFNANPSLNIQRPLLNYPAVVFTGKYQGIGQDPVQLLINSVNVQGDNKTPAIADPDVTKLEIKVEVETLRLDNLLSDSGRENYVTLYSTTRNFPGGFDDTLNLPVTFRDVNSLNLGDLDDPFNDVTINKPAIDAMNEIILPTARKIRVTLRGLCEGDSSYYGFTNAANHDLDSRYGKKTQFFFYKESADETDLLLPKANVPTVQALYLQPDPIILNDGTFKWLFFRKEKTVPMPDMVQRLAKELGVKSKGLTLTAKKGERVVFGCSSKIRHSLSPDQSSITFASKSDLSNHWLGCIVYHLKRDWSWDALQDVAFTIGRNKKFKHDDDSEMEELAVLGDIEMKHSASFESLQADTFGFVDRSSTTIIFIDAIEPKTGLLKNPGGPLKFPDEIEVQYFITPSFKPNHATGNVSATQIDPLLLPTTIIPAQVPKITSVGIAFSPYMRNEKYSATEPRQRYLWVELEEPVQDPNDTLFCRMLAYAPDQLLSNNHPELLAAPEEPPLPIDPEYTRYITPNQSDDMAGLSAMQPMEKANDDDDIHYLLPLPPGLNPESDELFGFFTYEFRMGHGHWSDRDDNLWSTAQGRFGRALRITGMQHPAPTLLCTVNRDDKLLYVNAHYAQAVWNGKNVTSDPPRTRLYALLYAQVKQADDLDYRNILLDEKFMTWTRNFDVKDKLLVVNEDVKLSLFKESQLYQQGTQLTIVQPSKFNFTDASIIKGAQVAIFKDQPKTALGLWTNTEIAQWLLLLGLPEDSPLSVLVVEVFGNITNIREHINLFNRTAAGNAGDERFNVNTDVRHAPLHTMMHMTSAAAGTAAAATAAQDIPLSTNLGNFRILRTSPLTEVPFVCCPTC